MIVLSGLGKRLTGYLGSLVLRGFGRKDLGGGGPVTAPETKFPDMFFRDERSDVVMTDVRSDIIVLYE